MILLNGVVFGAFHLSFQTVIRFVPTAMLGALIAWTVWRTGSIWVGMLMHFLNNATIVLLTSLPSVREVFNDPEVPPPLWLVPAGALALALGVVWVVGTTRRDEEGREPLMREVAT
jgi:sodium transport system permease protein